MCMMVVFFSCMMVVYVYDACACVWCMVHVYVHGAHVSTPKQWPHSPPFILLIFLFLGIIQKIFYVLLLLLSLIVIYLLSIVELFFNPKR